MKVYVVIQVSSDGYDPMVAAVFLDEKKADKYIEIKNAIDEPYYSYYKNVEETQDDNVNLNSKTAKYYEYYFNFGDLDRYTEKDLQNFVKKEELNKLTPEQKKEKLKEINHPENRCCNDEEQVVRIDDGNLTIEYNDDAVTVYSKKSFEEAKKIALDLWKKYE